MIFFVWATFVALSNLPTRIEALQCLRCSDTFEPRLCNRIEACNKGEVCGVRLYRTDNGDTSFWTGCMSSLDCTKTVNRTVINSKRDGSSHIPGVVLCTECCVGDLCNSEGCGAVGYPTSRGPLCYDCRDIHAPHDCHKIAPCSSNEKCLVEERTVFGQRYFTSRCEHGQTCESLALYPSAFGRRRAVGDKCHQCCHGDLCNNNCNLANGVTASSTAQTVRSTTSAPVSSNVAFFAKTTLVSSSGRIIFNQTSVNIGGGYNAGSGLFTCPHAGIYMFAFGIDSHGYSVQTYLTRNGRAVGVAAITDPKMSSIDDSSTAFAVLRLNTNDEVVVQRDGSQDPNNGFFAGWQISPLDIDAVAFTVALNTSSYSSSQIPFNSVTYDNRGSYQSINHSFTALESGLYVIGLTGEQTRGQYGDLGIQINGNTGLNTFADSEGIHSDSSASLAVFNLNSGDNVRGAGSHFVGYRGTTTFSAYKVSNRSMPAFTALLSSDTSSTNIVFNDVIVNTHHDYDHLTGEFTCSVPGTYLFTWNAVTNGHSLRTRLVIQIKGGSHIDALDIVGEENKGDEYDSSTGVFIYSLNSGDTVRIVKITGTVEGGYSSFSGWMLF
uniref:C1q domain-containing protein n=2 Tax=Magallana gigas TaxID=29159 RepID=A0A8W8ND58_MAGGI|nr:uncharacterized protein LOC105348215 isoform X2 [Crassostrea gigas]